MLRIESVRLLFVAMIIPILSVSCGNLEDSKGSHSHAHNLKKTSPVVTADQMQQLLDSYEKTSTNSFISEADAARSGQAKAVGDQEQPLREQIRQEYGIIAENPAFTSADVEDLTTGTMGLIAASRSGNPFALAENVNNLTTMIGSKSAKESGDGSSLDLDETLQAVIGLAVAALAGDMVGMVVNGIDLITALIM